MFTNRFLHLLIVVAVLIVTACSPQSEATVEPTALPTFTSTAEPTPVSTITPTAIPQATDVGSFPIGTFVDSEDPHARFVFTKDGRWSHWEDTFRSAYGTYSVEGDIYFELTIKTVSISTGCAPISFRFSFDGTLLKFQLTDESRNDPCPNRTGWYENTYIFSQ